MWKLRHRSRWWPGCGRRLSNSNWHTSLSYREGLDHSACLGGVFRLWKECVSMTVVPPQKLRISNSLIPMTCNSFGLKVQSKHSGHFLQRWGGESQEYQSSHWQLHVGVSFFEQITPFWSPFSHRFNVGWRVRCAVCQSGSNTENRTPSSISIQGI